VLHLILTLCSRYSKIIGAGRRSARAGIHIAPPAPASRVPEVEEVAVVAEVEEVA
jgi:hypothetical protein